MSESGCLIELSPGPGQTDQGQAQDGMEPVGLAVNTRVSKGAEVR